MSNKNLNAAHLKTQHPMASQHYEEAKTNKVSDPDDETVSVVPFFNLKNHSERADFLVLMSII